MGTRKPDYRRIKRERTYALDELARLLGCHANTVRNWRKDGLEPIDGGRPQLFKGEVVIAFLKQRREHSRKTCPPGTFFCLGCRAPHRPAGDMAEYLPATHDRGALRGICPRCDRLIYRRVRQADLPTVAHGLDVSCTNPTQP